MKSVLIASDDAHTTAWVTDALADTDVTLASASLTDVRRKLLAGDVHLLVLDAGRSAQPAIQDVEHAVSVGSDVKLLVVIERDGLAQMRMPLSLRADFVVRGSTAEELAARVRLLLWPGEEATDDEILRIGELSINLATYQAHLHSKPIDFTYLEYALFAFLVTHPGRTYSREALLQRVWGTEYYGGSRTVDVHIRRIRAKIGSELSSRLETVRNVGYLWKS